ncbi:hypothetical protein BDQ94DRAFT_147409 [Aspergillus welwitschiae]|uniref:Uncharacterized protein n=1 Tax=Aspergillus welwitschiae TaxID=1341132 RepID=A0A3F3PXD7_9EURO|nr:hypothetical protein BDQ94DRAFT_147409 [Aspergillus welwitschiae]RDH31432.1 hypothetical protein BDQ94DRAFT_147409 [Aspergillus welwitschiae]
MEGVIPDILLSLLTLKYYLPFIGSRISTQPTTRGKLKSGAGATFLIIGPRLTSPSFALWV